MRVGITYDLREEYTRKGYTEDETAEFDSLETIEAIELALRTLGHSTDRIGHARALLNRLVKGDRWDMVFNIAEGLHGFGREALVPALLDTYEIPYTFSDPLTLCVALHKATAKHVVRDQGIRTPDFEVIKWLPDVEKVALPFPLFIKPVAEGSGKGTSVHSKIDDILDLRSGCEQLLTRYRQPVLIEIFLPGREFDVGIVGTGRAAHALGVMEIVVQEEPDLRSDSTVDIPDNVRSRGPFESGIDRWGRNVCYCLAADEAAAEAKQMALDVWRGLGCRDGGRVELRCDAKGRPNFIEVNPLTGLRVDSHLIILGRLMGVPFLDVIKRIVASASGCATM